MNNSYFEHEFDVSRKRSPHMEDYIDAFLNDGNFYIFHDYEASIQSWKYKCENKIQKSLFSQLRRKQYESILDDDYAFRFYFTREHTRYRQQNYVKTPYKVTDRTDSFACDYTFLKNRDNLLREIGYEATLRDFHSKNQRKLMTPQLRNEIYRRTCKCYVQNVMDVNLIDNYCLLFILLAFGRCIL